MTVVVPIPRIIAVSALAAVLKHLPVTARQRDEVADRFPDEADKAPVAWRSG
jgi:hypothetical protein